MPRGNPQTGRNTTIKLLLKSRRLSYSVIAEMTGTTRNAVAGVAFRLRHPRSMMIPSPSNRNKPNKIGHGWQPHSYEPEKTALNTR